MATDVILVVHLLLLLVSVHATIDSILQEVEDRNERERLSHPSGKEVKRRGWDVYTVENSTDEYVKYQLDMIIKKDKLKSLLARKKPRRRNQRNAVEEDSQLWPTDIPYVIDDEFNQDQIINISNAIIHVMGHTCVDFWLMKEGQQEPQYIKFMKSITGCNSEVGRTGHREQLINLEDSCLRVNVVAHEILHALGLYHEHMRHDRDKYVTIHRKNIKPGKKKEFEKLKEGKYRSFNKPYDYRSLMHYGKDSYGKTYNRTHKKITIEPKQPEYLDVIGNAPGLSFHDIKILNSMYKCAAGCEKKRCPDETQFIGKNCECYCQGPPHDAAVLCDRPPESCYLDDGIVTGKYMYTVLHLPEEEELNVTNNPPVRSNASIEISHLDPMICGFHTLKTTCNNGTWDRNLTLPCIQERCQLGPTWNNTYWMFYEKDPSDNTTGLAHDMPLEIQCLSDGNINTTLECNKGKWKGQMQPCPGDCDNPDKDKVLNGHVIFDSNDIGVTEHGESIGIVCARGFEIARGESYRSVYCDHGVWIGLPSECIPSGCDYPAGVLNGAVNVDDLYDTGTGIIEHGERIEVVCSEGFEITEGESSRNVTCRLGVWKEGLPTECTPTSSCPKFRPFDNGVVTYYKDSIVATVVAVFKCDSGADLIPNVTHATCMQDETWTYNPRCRRQLKIHEGIGERYEKKHSSWTGRPWYTRLYDREVLKHDAEVRMQCSPDSEYELYRYGIFLNTQYFSSKNNNGVWDPELPSCKPKRCVVPNTNHGTDSYGDESVAQGKLLHGTNVTTTCDEGYEIKRGQTVEVNTCDKGRLSAPRCSEKPCPVPKDPPDFTRYSPSYGIVRHGRQIEIVCSEGFEITEGESSRTVTCRLGDWKEGLPTECTPKKCLVSDDLGDLDVMKITDADMKTLSRDTLVDSGVILEPTCNKGFEPRAGQTPQISCDRGNWTEIFMCDERNCSVPDIKYGMVYNWPRMSKLLPGKHVSRGDKVRVNCKEGYKIEGSATQDDTGIFTCDDGEWDQPINCVLS